MIGEMLYVLFRLEEADYNHQDQSVAGLFTTLELAQAWAVANGAEPKWTLFPGSMLKADDADENSQSAWAIEIHVVRQ